MLQTGHSKAQLMHISRKTPQRLQGWETALQSTKIEKTLENK